MNASERATTLDATLERTQVIVIEFLAQAKPAAPGGGGFGDLLHSPMFVPMIVLFGVMYFVMILPKRKQDKQRQTMLKEMKRGDEVQTIGGIIGKVVEAREDKVLVKVDESSNTKIWFARSAIARVATEDVKVATTK